jgi:hypothetical protein
MSYWHQRDDGTWSFDWTHLVPILPLILYGLYVFARWMIDQS